MVHPHIINPTLPYPGADRVSMLTCIELHVGFLIFFLLANLQTSKQMKPQMRMFSFVWADVSLFSELCGAGKMSNHASAKLIWFKCQSHAKSVAANE